MCEKPSNYLVLESQFSNGLKLFIVLLSTSPQPTLQPVRLRNCSGGGVGAAFYCTLPRSGLQGARGGCKQFSLQSIILTQHSVLLLVDNESLTNKCLLLPLCLEFFWSRPRCTRRSRAALSGRTARGMTGTRAAAVAGGPAAFSPFIQEQNVWSIYLLETTKNTNCYLSRILNSSSILHCPHQTATFTRPNIYNWGCVCFKYVGNLVEFLKSLLFQI